MKRAPNSEQKIAIEHMGNVVLKAGAGSGKTFVLKEHIIYLLTNQIAKSKSNSQSIEEFRIEIKKYLRKIVMMTFTKKAAGELSLRVEKEVLELKNAEVDGVYWEAIFDSFNSLSITTIHGFCFQLIKQGFFPLVTSDQDIVSELEYKKKISDIVEEYFSVRDDSNVIQLFNKNIQSIVGVIQEIFQDASLRLDWKNLIENHHSISDGNEATREILNMVGVEFLKDFFSSYSSEYAGKKWFDFALKFESFVKNDEIGIDFLLKCYEFFENLDFKIPSKPSIKTVDPDVVCEYEKIKDFKDFLKKEGQHFYQYTKNRNTFVSDWYLEVEKIFKYVDLKYSMSVGITFADLEYIVYENLKSQEVRGLVNTEYDYFIVDEFQDTSLIQYEILKMLINHDFQKLFCVGDIKQAIYGFRGGELGVFLDCESQVKNVYSLGHNYRSLTEVVKFNNKFFNKLFNLEKNHSSSLIKKVNFEGQTVPLEYEEKGQIICVNANLEHKVCDEEDEKLKTIQVDLFEAIGIANRVEQAVKNQEQIAVLYKKLKPSLLLMSLLMERDIGFRGQVKIPYSKDPIIGIFLLLIEKSFNKNANSEHYQELMIKGYLYILNNAKVDVDIGNLIKDFENNKRYYGLKYSFYLFLKSCRLSNSQFSLNSKFIETMIDLTNSNEEELLKQLTSKTENSFSMEFCFGRNSANVILMSAHGSKGLQFPHVVLGGIYSNENTRSYLGLFGKLPYSFKWRKEVIGKETFKTPQYILEEFLGKAKDFSENKRLFYVANTRAEKSLSWVKINFGENKRSRTQKHSWSGLIQSIIDNELEGDVINIDFNLSNYLKKNKVPELDNDRPFFHFNPLGCEFSVKVKPPVIMPELSVTKLATVITCPRKYYLQNICKIEREELELLGLESLITGSIPSSSSKSSAKRGIKIHSALESMVNSEFNDESTTEIAWAVDKLKKYMDNYQFISEKLIKFELMGYMITGIPDLIISPNTKNSDLEIWDYKTGPVDNQNNEHYWFQLYCYAYSQYNLNVIDEVQSINLVLCYIDAQKIVDRKVSFLDVEKYLTKKLELVNKPNLLNTSSCNLCEYQNICEKE